MQCTINITIQMWYYFENKLDHHIYIHILEILNIMSKLVFKEYLTPNVMQIT